MPFIYWITVLHISMVIEKLMSWGPEQKNSCSLLKTGKIILIFHCWGFKIHRYSAVYPTFLLWGENDIKFQGYVMLGKLYNPAKEPFLPKTILIHAHCRFFIPVFKFFFQEIWLYCLDILAIFNSSIVIWFFHNIPLLLIPKFLPFVSACPSQLKG